MGPSPISLKATGVVLKSLRPGGFSLRPEIRNPPRSEYWFCRLCHKSLGEFT